MKTSLKIYLLIQMFLFLLPVEVKSQDFNWVKGSVAAVGNAVTSDAYGNSYSIGTFTGTTLFDTIKLTSYGSNDIYIAKYDPNGNCLWAKQAGGLYLDIGYGISVDRNGNSIITGTCSGSVVFGTVHLSGAGFNGSDAFVAKYDPDGNCLWAKNMGGMVDDYGNGIAIDTTGNSYVTGYFTATATFGSIQLTALGNTDIFIAKFDPDGNYLWVKQAGGTKTDKGFGISVDPAGNCYTTGYYSYYPKFDSLQINTSTSGGYVAKYDPNGNCKWVQTVGNLNQNYRNSISIDPKGNCYVTGDFANTQTIGTFSLTSLGLMDVFIAKFDSNGNCLWATQAGGTTDDIGYGISVDTSGNSYVTGSFSGTASFGSSQLTTYGGNDIFVAKYDPNGNCLWVDQAGGTGADNGNGISVDAAGNRFVVGSFTGTGTFGAIQLSGGGSFIANLSASPIKITSPIGSEIWQTNTTHNITWNCRDDGNIKIELSTDNGNNWILLANNINASLCNYNLLVPAIQTSALCKIKLTSLSYNNFIVSPDVFTITSASTPNLTVTSPNSAVKWRGGFTNNIEWILTGNVQNVKLEYSTDNGISWDTITTSAPASVQSYAWAVPALYSTACRVRISDAVNPHLNDISDTLFTIDPANITLTSPNGGEILKRGTVKQITWSSIRIPNINIYYSNDSDIFTNPVATNYPASSGSFSWSVPNTISTNCKIKLENASDTTIISVSKNPFIIWQPIQAVQIPDLGSVNEYFGLTNITFSAFITAKDAMTVTYYPYEPPVAGSLPAGVALASNYYWTITSPAISFSNGAISVPVSSLMGVKDITKLVWLKRSNSGDAWTNIGDSLSNGRLISTVPFNSLSEFAIGSIDTSNDLPVELASFIGQTVNNSVKLSWTTITEANNNLFNIERKNLDASWQKIGELKGAGTSTTPIQYSFVDNNIPANGKYYYRLKQLDYNGQSKYSNEIEVSISFIPKVYSLENNFPNPFNPSTTIRYSLPFQSNVKLTIYNSLGQVIRQLVSEVQQSGNQEVNFNASAMPSGVYFYSIQANSTDGKQNYKAAKKMLLLK
ncbi:MAG: SBBP repeat-containing protein [Ignavibacteriaceae bacterium]|nr:SBBP repeat-containing protein [Ignavibacteriaceae bacterium]